MYKIIPNLRRSASQDPLHRLWGESVHVLENDMTALEDQKYHGEIFNFADNEQPDFEHGLCHQILRFAFDKMGYSPIARMFAHNGNYVSEALVETAQAVITTQIAHGEYQELTFNDFAKSVLLKYDENAGAENREKAIAFALASRREGEGPISSFEILREREFTPADDFFNAPEHQNLSLPEDGEENRYGEVYSVIRVTDIVDVLDEIFHHMSPALRFVQQKIRDADKTGNIPRPDKVSKESGNERRLAIHDIMGTIKDRHLWHSMPDGPAGSPFSESITGPDPFA